MSLLIQPLASVVSSCGHRGCCCMPGPRAMSCLVIALRVVRCYRCHSSGARGAVRPPRAARAARPTPCCRRRFQQRVPVPGVGDGQLVLLRLRGRRPPGGHRRAVAAGPVAHADPLRQPARARRGQRLHRRPHALPGQLQPVQRRHRRDHARGIGALLPARPEQATGGQPRQQRIQRHLLQPRLRHLAPELRQHRMTEPRILQRQPQQVLPVQPGPHRLSRQPVGQLLCPLQDSHQRQPRRRPARPATDPEHGREILIGQPLAQPPPDLHRQRPLRLPGPYIASIAAATCESGSGHGGAAST